jgi:hypothetical protein
MRGDVNFLFLIFYSVLEIAYLGKERIVCMEVASIFVCSSKRYH